MDKSQIRARQRARELALQALYQWLLADHPMIEIEAQFRSIHKMDKVDVAYFSQLIHGVVQNRDDIDTAFSPFLDRKMTELNPVELSVLRLGTYELMFAPEVPYRVILEESVILTKAFGAQEGFRYVNGVLNQVARKCRSIEIDH